MITAHLEPPEEIAKFRAHPFPFQQSFQTPLRELERFVQTFLTPFSFEKGYLSTDQVVFGPDHLLEFLACNSIHVESQWSFHLRAEGARQIAELLVATLSDWIDFVFVPVPEFFAVYADHAEYTTFYAPAETILHKLTLDLQNAGFVPVDNYMRPTSGKTWK